MSWWFFGLFEPNMSISEPDFQIFMRFFAMWYRNFGTLEITLSVLQCPWKPHKSKEHTFLSRNYVPTFFSTPKKKLKKSRQKTFFENFHLIFWFFRNSQKTFLAWLFFNFFLELRKKVEYNFDVKNCVLSIYEVFNDIGVRKVWFLVSQSSDTI